MPELKLLSPPGVEAQSPRRAVFLPDLVPGDPLSTSDLRAFAKYFAQEFEFRPERARWEPASWYREQVGADLCSDGEARLLREMTAEQCRYGYLDGPEQPSSSPDLRAFFGKLKRIGAAVAECALLLAVLLGLALAATILEPQDDGPLPDPSSTQQVAAPPAGAI